MTPLSPNAARLMAACDRIFEYENAEALVQLELLTLAGALSPETYNAMRLGLTTKLEA